MNHLNGMDAMFLHCESAEMPLHVGSFHVLELPEGYAGDFYEDVKAFIGERMHLASVFTRKLANMPFDLSDPVWVEDEDIDLEHHIRHVTLPKPGSNRQLEQTVARLHSSLLDRSRPLWELYVIDGLRNEREVAFFVKLHHAGMDGQAGIEMGRAIFDGVPSGRKVKPPRPKLRRNQYQLGVAELAGAAVLNTGRQYIKLAKMVPDMLRAARHLLPAKGEDGKRNWFLLKPSGLVAPRTPLNVSITNQRSFAGRTVPMADIKRIAKALEVSFNDVVMATVSGALRRYLKDSEELPGRSMSAAVPVSLRELGDDTANNQVSMLVMDLVTSEADPLKRLRRISSAATQRKASLNNFKSIIPNDFPIFAAPWLISGLASMYGRSRMADWLPPPSNLVISNVAGIPAQIYFAGAKVVSYYPVSIPCHGMALNVTVASYNGRLDYGLIACRRALPDLNELGDHLLAEHRLLLELANAQAEAPSEPAKAKAKAAPRPKASPLVKATPLPKASRPAKAAPKAKAKPAPATTGKASLEQEPASGTKQAL
ncbi:WS/DGAT/MGAT family O-acyltransferase [Zestomonas carbonaria]|uniref:diacylglycerol O-acyltransferase n=1 Tax=Zestomonas carbonaria TaxID=2762745 RepID=A0A7U7EP13_9GAMM|nr:wax ester/triacylglycerol synthase family O-acyltransferase [Pseudomonas carbonaria]CAD5108436.1 Putative diacylglycerol O-acyltransferase [Pseudomonas carbonaria]